MKNFYKNNKSLIWIIISSFLAAGLIYFVVWLCFVGTGFIPTGISLEKRDWLAFLGGFLGFIGSVVIGAIAFWQNKKMNEVNAKVAKLQEDENTRNRQSYITIQKDFKFSNFSIPNGYFSFCKKHNVTSCLVSAESFDKLDEENLNKYYTCMLELSFTSEQNFIKNMYITKISFNDSFKEETDIAIKNCYMEYFIAKWNKPKVLCTTDPKTNIKTLNIIFLNQNREVFDNMIKNNLFVLDFTICIVSVFNIVTEMKIAINFPIARFKKIIKSKEEVVLDDIVGEIENVDYEEYKLIT